MYQGIYIYIYILSVTKNVVSVSLPFLLKRFLSVSLPFLFPFFVICFTHRFFSVSTVSLPFPPFLLRFFTVLFVVSTHPFLFRFRLIQKNGKEMPPACFVTLSIYILSGMKQLTHVVGALFPQCFDFVVSFSLLARCFLRNPTSLFQRCFLISLFRRWFLFRCFNVVS